MTIDSKNWTGESYDDVGNTKNDYSIQPVGPSPSDGDKEWEHKQENWKKFEEELRSLINKYSLENGSETPDFVLANFLTNVLRDWDSVWLMKYNDPREQEWDFQGLVRETFDTAVAKRDKWYAPKENVINTYNPFSFMWEMFATVFVNPRAETVIRYHR
jgi:hypothetical protein